MSLRESTATASASLVRSERITLPAGAGEAEVRGMTLGDRLRVGTTENKHGAERSVPLMIAFCTYELDGTRVWQPNDLRDLDAIRALAPEIAEALQNAAIRVSGLDGGTEAEEGKP
jgi:hypothetical protein